MLTEFAFTPGVFERDSYESDEVWSETLRALRAEMFPRTGPSPIVVSDLFNQALTPVIQRRVDEIENHEVRDKAKKLFTLMKKVAVSRPGIRDWPNDTDISWCEEAVASHRDEPIARIVSTRSAINHCELKEPSLFSVDQTNDDAFWNGIGVTSYPRRITDEQVGLLRTMLLHAHWIAIINPYALDSEREFVRAIYANATKRSPGYRIPDFEIHGQLDSGRLADEEVERQQSNAESLRNDLSELNRIESSISVSFWPKFVDRYVVAGTYTATSSQSKRKKMRWGVYTGHVARANDQSDERSPWHLISKEVWKDLESNFLSIECRRKNPPFEIGLKERE